MELETLKSVLSIIDGTDVLEVELEEAGKKIRVRRGPPSGAAPSTQESAPPPPPPTAVAPSLPAPVAAAEVPASHHELKSPMVGTYYRSADPAAPPFVSVGDVVKKGQVLCIVEAMKLMNEIESDVAGEILKIHPENGHPVQFGEPLFTIKAV